MAKALSLGQCDGGAKNFQQEALLGGYRRLPTACGLASASDVGRILARNGTSLAGAAEKMPSDATPRVSGNNRPSPRVFSKRRTRLSGR